jgi:hypothetical protein
MSFGVIVAIVLAVLLLLAIGFVAGLGQAKKAYDDSLEQLEQEPHNTDLEEKTLALGRQYASRLRSVGLGWVFNEVALRNDIQAALAQAESNGATHAHSSRASVKRRGRRPGGQGAV